MTVSNDYEEYAGGNWTFEVNTNDYSENLMRAEFEQSVNQPLSWNAKLQGVESTNSDFNTKNNVKLLYNSNQAFKGRIIEPGPDSRTLSFNLEGLGLAYDLQRTNTNVFYPGKAYNIQAVDTANETFTVSGDKTQQFDSGDYFTVANSTGNDGQYSVSSVSLNSNNDTVITVNEDVTDSTADGEIQMGNTDDIIKTIVGSTVGISTNTRLNSPGSDDFASVRGDDDSKISVINRLVGDYGAEWWLEEDNNGNAVLNVDTQRGGGSSVKTYDESNTENIAKTDDAGQGEYDGVVVKGYGDGDDQIRATAGNTGDNDEVLTHVDKTITSSSQAQSKADSLKTSHVDGSWTRVKVQIADPNVVRTVGDVVTVKSDDAGITTATDYRIVETFYSIDFEGNVSAELICNNRPSTYYNTVEETKEQTESQTQYMQGNRNTINETEKELADQNNPVKIEFNIPSRFTEDVTNNDRTAQARLDFVVDDYKKSFSGTQTAAIDTTQVVKTEVDDFGNVDAVNTERRERNDTNETLGRVIESDTTSAGGSSKIDEASQIQVSFNEGVFSSGWNQVGSVISPDGSTTQGMDVWIWAFQDFGGSTSGNSYLRFRLQNDVTGDYFPTSDGIEAWIMDVQAASGEAATSIVKIHVPENTDFEDYEIQARAENNDEDWSINWNWVTYDTHKHSIPDNDTAVDKVQSYMADTQGAPIPSGENSSQGTQSVGGDSTTNINELDADDVVISTQSTTADELSVVLNGNTLSNSPFSLSSGPPYKKEDIDLPLADLNTPGFNTLELIPNNSNDASDTGKSLVKGNVIVDHKIDVER